MAATYTLIQNIDEQIPAIPPDSIVSRTLHNTANLKMVIFGFAPGQELSEHTSARPAILHFLRGEAKLMLGSDHYMATAGTWVQMPARLPHSVFAQTEVVMLLLMMAADE